MEFVTVRSFDNYISAHLMLQRLEEEGIKAYLKDEHIVTINPILSHVVGGIKLMVYEPQLSRASELVEAMEAVVRSKSACPQCGSLNVQYITKPREITNWVSALITWLLGSYAVAVRHVYHCFDCDYEFQELTDN